MCECCKCGSVRIDGSKLKLALEKLKKNEKNQWQDGPHLTFANGEKPLLVIVQQDINSVPEVHYKGEELNLKREINFDWKTHGDNDFGYGTSFDAEYYDKELEMVVKEGYQDKFYQ